jgi:uncharacterized protein GlcG (DUF336 family)
MKRVLVSGSALSIGVAAIALIAMGSVGRIAVHADQFGAGCPVSHRVLQNNLGVADAEDSTGLNNHYWAFVVNREGVVCAVAFSGHTRDAQWLLSRQIAAAKAFTANGLSLDGAPLSTAQLYPWVQPGAPVNPLFGLAGGNPVSPDDAYKGSYDRFGTNDDPMIGKRVGGTITFGGGLGLYSGASAIGGLGLSGDTACADHSTAWRLRNHLGMSPSVGDDKITLDNAAGHPHCPNDSDTQGKS